ncbi:MAG: carboxylesterase family protein [Myxococcota bacterium]
MGESGLGASRYALVEARAGALRGVVADGIYSFKGVPYGEPTGGERRFLPPVEAARWSGVKDALEYGPDAPQGGSRDQSAALQNNLAREPAEDCLVLNVWTPDLGDGARRPVMFWCHGGGFVSGSGSGALYSGEQLARRGDVVVVSINHRLGALGFLSLADVDPAAGSSVNLGMLDIVLALEWVRDNIETFGGDPGNVMIFGESGGGRKVTALLAMPLAQGLFHRAAIQSGPAVFLNDREAVRRLAELLLAELAVTREPLRSLQARPLAEILEAQAVVLRRVGRSAEGLAQTFAPVVDGEILPHHPFDPEAPAISDHIPVIVGYNRTEATLFMGRDPDLLELDDAGLARRIDSALGDEADRVLEIYKKAHPEATCSDLLAYILTGLRRYPIDSIKLAERKSLRGQAPAYLYTLTYRTPAARGALRTPHALEIPFVFDNVEGSRRFVGGGDAPVRLADAMSGAWIAFAHTGSPHHEGIPEWPAYSLQKREQMIFDVPCRIESDFNAAERAAWEPLLYATPEAR